MSQELQLGKYEFYPNDRIQQLLDEIMFELRLLRRGRRFAPEYTEDELDRLMRMIKLRTQALQYGKNKKL